MSGGNSFKDNFSAVAGTYARHRPTYPYALFDWLTSVAPAREMAWDCTCGNGQAAVGLVAQAAHWFDFEAFFAEVKRVGRVGGVLALAAYELHRVTPEIDAITDQFYEPVLGDYWQPERRHIKAGYRDIPFPFQNIATPELFMAADWTAADCIGFLNTWSSIRRYREETGKDPLADFIGPTQAAWGSGARIVR